MALVTDIRLLTLNKRWYEIVVDPKDYLDQSQVKIDNRMDLRVARKEFVSESSIVAGLQILS